MDITIFYILMSVLLVSIVSLIGIFTFIYKSKNLEKILLYLVSFSVGALLGDVFIHLLPEAFESAQDMTIVGLYVLCGIMFSFFVEKFIQWRHCHHPETKSHHHSFAYMNLVGDAVHNFIDGIIIAGAYIVSIPVGIATTIAVLLHEIPQEIGDFGVLVYGGFSKAKALWFNFLTALTAVFGAIVGFLMSSHESLLAFVVPFAAGNLIYIAGSDLIPQLHDNTCETVSAKKSFAQMSIVLLGIAVMVLMLLLE